MTYPPCMSGHFTPVPPDSCCRQPHEADKAHDLFIAQEVAAWAGERMFSQERWHFDAAPDEWIPLHHVAGGAVHPGSQDRAGLTW
jgi:hypothetical protein